MEGPPSVERQREEKERIEKCRTGPMGTGDRPGTETERDPISNCGFLRMGPASVCAPGEGGSQAWVWW